MEENASFTQNWMQIPCSTHSVILNAKDAQHTCSHNGINRPPDQYNEAVIVPIHSPWCPGYLDAVQTILIILTVAGLFPDKTHTSVNTYGILKMSKLNFM